MGNLFSNSYQRNQLIKTVAATGTPERLTSRTIASIARQGTGKRILVTTTEAHGFANGAKVYMVAGTSEFSSARGYVITVHSATTFSFMQHHESTSVASEGCVESDIALATGLLSFWPLTDHVSAFSGNDEGPTGQDFVNNSVSTEPYYFQDTERGAGAGAMRFERTGDMWGLKADDAGGLYINTAADFTVGCWFRPQLLQSAGVLQSTAQPVLTYHVGTTVQYQIRYVSPNAAGTTQPHFRAILKPTAGGNFTMDDATVVTVGAWYWVELQYNATTKQVTLRVVPKGTSAFDAPGVAGTTSTVPAAGLNTSAGALSLGYYGSGATGSIQGDFGPVAFWTKLITDCERGRIVKPTDHPFTALAARTCYADMFVRQATILGQKAAQTNNTGDVRIGLDATDNTQGYLLEPGLEISLNGGMPAHARVNLASYYIDVDNVGDGAVVLFS